jgi:hypothetical protein
MTTSRTTSVAVALTAFALASTSTHFGGEISAQASPTAVFRLSETAERPSGQIVNTERAVRSAYGWPVKPFHRQHPVRGFFGDPRISNHGRTRQFHFGVDISAPNETAVYATLTGRVWIHPLHRTTIAIVGDDGLELSYWHVVPTVRTGTKAIAYKTVIGHIEAPYGHVHFAESRNGRYLNPLRPGAMGPYVDHTRPRLLRVSAERDGRRLAANVRLATFDLVVEVEDETPLAVPRPWHGLHVMPALVRWRVLDESGHPASEWKTAVDFRQTIPPASEFDRVWAPGATQNHVRAPGSYRLTLAHDIDRSSLRGRQIEVLVADTRGNASRARFGVRELLRGS